MVVLLDTDNAQIRGASSVNDRSSANRYDVEDAIVADVNAGRSDTLAYFQQPLEARFVISERMDREGRSTLAADDPAEKLQRYMLFRYLKVAAAMQAAQALEHQPGVIAAGVDTRTELSWAPNDPYFPQITGTASDGPTRFQWGIHAMRFPEAWDRTKGHGYVAVVDTGVSSGTAPNQQGQPPADLSGNPATGVIGNYRQQFSAINGTQVYYDPHSFHGTHVIGTVAAIGNNSHGAVGGCPTCSVSMVYNGTYSAISWTNAADSYTMAIHRGAQVINYSGGSNDTSGCEIVSRQVFCNAVNLATTRDTLGVAAAGNKYNQNAQFPASLTAVLSVGGAQWLSTWWLDPTGLAFWQYDSVTGSSNAGLNGVVGPAKSIISTVPTAVSYISVSPYHCGDTIESDESGTSSDGFGSCTGTSMAAPHISALAGILRSVNPRLSRSTIMQIIRASGSHASQPNAQRGYGLPNAQTAVNQAISQTTNKLTPLFSMYSGQRQDYFYTTVPQMASAASWGTLQPVNTSGTASQYASAAGSSISGYSTFPGGYVGTQPLAAVWVFTTPENPKNASVPLVPLYRMSWKCGDPSSNPPPICSTQPNHSDTVYTADPAGLPYYGNVGYKLDGIEGYIYPKTMSPQPLGTVRLMRKYKPEHDDHAIFPETQLVTMEQDGYDQNSGSDWLGYVYPNITGNTPPIL